MPSGGPSPVWGNHQLHKNAIERLGAAVLNTTEALGHDAILFFRSILSFNHIVRKFREIVRQMSICGVMSFPVVVLVAIFAGAVLALQSGRVGSAMAAELGTMRASEEIDALEAMSIDPVGFLVMPRLVAMVIMAPVLTIYANMIGILGGALVGYYQVDVPFVSYFDKAYGSLVMLDVNSGLIKSVVFGVIITIVGCGRGLRAQSSAEGVGKATKDSVVVSFILIIVFNYVITSFVRHLY